MFGLRIIFILVWQRSAVLFRWATWNLELGAKSSKTLGSVGGLAAKSPVAAVCAP